MRRSRVILALALAAQLNIFPLWLMRPGGDIFFHLVALDCFSQQFWQGDLYPRWCMSANAGVGAPFFLFYFPLPYYAVAWLYGSMPVESIYIAGLLMASVITALTCYSWLKDVVTPERALLASVVFLFIPYRMEAMFFRSAYAEIWCIAWLPLLFKYTRRLAQGEGENTVIALAGVCALMFLSHVPCAMVGLIASSVYLAVMTRKDWQPKIRYAVSVGWGIALAAFYLFPAAYYRQFITPDSAIRSAHMWVNHYLTMENLSGQTRVVITIGISVLTLSVVACYMMRRRERIADPFIRREIGAWVAVFVAGLFLLLPISAPFYAVIGPLKEVIFPWRMQGMFVVAAGFLLAVWLQYYVSERRMKTWKGDFSLLLFLLLLISFFLFSMRDASYQETGDKILASHQGELQEYRTKWTDRAHYTQDYVFSRYDLLHSIPQAEILSGRGTIEIEHWGWDGIRLHVQSQTGMQVRLTQQYFPVWGVDTGDAELHPETDSGLMFLDIPRGEQPIVLQASVARANPGLVHGATWLSVLAGLFWLWKSYCRKLMPFCHQ